MALKLTITTPDGLVHQGEAAKVIVPAFDGELGILPRHAALIGQLGVGELRVSPAQGGALLRFFVAGGFMEVLDDKVTVLATRAEAARAIDSRRAEEELQSLVGSAPPSGTAIAERDARMERIRAARARVRVAGNAAG